MAQVPRFFSWPCSVRLRGLPPLALDVVGAFDQHAAGAGGGIADAHPFGRRQQLHDEPDHHPRRVELAALLAGIVGEVLDQVLVGAAEEVGLGHAVVAERDLGEVPDEARKHGVAVTGVAELAFVVVVDAGEDAFQRAVLLLQRRARLVQGLPDVRGPLLDGVPPRPLRHEELVLVRVGPRDGFGQPLGDELLRLLLEAIGQPFEEEQAEDAGLVVAAVDRPAQDVGRRPEGLFELGDAQHVGRGCGTSAGEPGVLVPGRSAVVGSSPRAPVGAAVAHGSHGASFARTAPMMPCGKKSTSTSNAPPTTKSQALVQPLVTSTR